MEGYRPIYFLVFLYYIFCFISLGSFALISRWVPWLYTKTTHRKTGLKTASVVLLVSKMDQISTPCYIETIKIKNKEFKCFRYRNSLYIYNEIDENFERIM